MSAPIRTVDVKSTAAPLEVEISVGPHRLTGDEPLEDGGSDRGPAPFELLGAALASCTVMTLKLYAARKGWPMTSARCEIEQTRGEKHRFDRRLVIDGPLTQEQRTRLVDIANHCPVHKALVGDIVIVTTLA